MNSPIVTILCLCYNQSRFIVESLESLKAQTFSDFEIIICDDSSKDNSVEIIENWINENTQLQIKFIKHQENKGICKSLNEIFKLSSGKYIQMLALDDTLLPDKLERHVSILDQSSEKEVMVFSDALIMDQNSVLYDNRFIAYHINYLRLDTNNYYDQLMVDNFIPAMSVLIKSKNIKDIGGWDENLTYEDYDMWLRLSRDFNFIFDHEPSCKYRIHENNTHRKKDLLNDSYFHVLYKHSQQKLVKDKLFKIVEYKFLNNELNNEHLLFYKVYKCDSFSDKLVKSNKNVFLYKFIKSAKQFVTNIS